MNDLTSSPINNLPLIVIAGRPNVGKSTLFNRLVGKRRAITDETPGVTRDVVQGQWQLGDLTANLVDTGGISDVSGEIHQLVSERAMEFIRRGDLVFLLLEATDITPEDELLIKKLRPFADKILLVVNKADNPEREEGVWNYHRLGFKTLIAISAVHGRNIDTLGEKTLDVLKERGSHKLHPGEMEPGNREGDNKDDQAIRLALLGKPNTGKSTLANRLTGTSGSLVSSIPGTTRDVVEGRFLYKNRAIHLLDTAGIRRKKKVYENIEYYSVNRAIASIEEADVVVLLIDAVEGLTEQDKKIAAQVVKWGRGIVLVLNKWDLLKKIPNQLEAVSDRIRFLFPVLEFAPILPLSAKEGEGMEKLLSTVLKVYSQLQRQVQTAKLNKNLQEWVFKHPPPSAGRKHYKVKYLTQVSSHPLRFRMFVNRKMGFPRGYVHYVTNQIRKDFGFSSVPLSVDVKE